MGPIHGNAINIVTHLTTQLNSTQLIPVVQHDLAW